MLFRSRTVLVTGGAGFIGSNLVAWLLRNEPDLQIITLDALTYSGNVESLAAACAAGDGSARHYFIRGDIRDGELVRSILAGNGQETDTRRAAPRPDALIHLAAESHVDRSLLGAAEFVSTNVQGTQTLLEATRVELEERPREFRFINVSTDEVYGSLGANDPPFTEASPLSPNSPYSAAKAGADCLVRAYRESFNLPCLTTRCSNNYGAYQFPEKLIPLVITRALINKPIPVYGDGKNVRDWIHVEDHAAAIWAVCTRGRLTDELYNIGGESERSNIDIVQRLLALLKKPDSLIQYVTDRRGHDRRYAMDISRIRGAVGWSPKVDLEEGLRATVSWYEKNRGWWERVLSEAYRAARSLYLAAETADLPDVSQATDHPASRM